MRRDRDTRLLQSKSVPGSPAFMDKPPERGQHRLRINRVTLRSAVYLITFVTAKRRPLFFQQQCAEIVANALMHYHERRYVHGFAWVVMPDHVHWVMQLRVGSLPYLMQRMKTWTSWQIRKCVSPVPPKVWANGYHDRRVRHNEHLANYIGYVILNPVRKHLVNDPRDYPYLYAESELLDIAGAEPEAFSNPLEPGAPII